MEAKQISKEKLKSLLEKLKADGKQLYEPTLEAGRIQSTQSAKSVVFPRTEKLFSYKKDNGDVVLRDYNPDALPETVVFGIHPCDAAGFRPLGSIFNWDTADMPYNERRKRTTLITVSCTQCDEYCFCTSVNGGPGNTDGSDILLTPVKDNYLVEIITDKGAELVAQYNSFFDAAPDNINKEDFLAKVPVYFSVEEITKKLSGTFGNEKLWAAQSERCLGCGACAFVCPTCACFDIQENAQGNVGSRIRCWDSCGFSLFTLHTSGHNPRSTQSQRWRQRIMHKFSYMPERLSVVGCTGCGRCSRACPVDINIREQITIIGEKLKITN
ncbi:hydrogenase subunit beta [Candidatus Symbiothrix dinenymphae]|nr:hydrogenase subunit beta [Candidatus Symbiothrix dinenymphae]